MLFNIFSKKMAFSAVLLSTLASTQLFAAVPQQISNQGFITDKATGQALSGSKEITFKLYVAGQDTPVWEEVNPNVVFKQGLYDVKLGSINPIDVKLFSGKELSLGIALKGETEFAPRLTFNSVPYAMSAQTALNVTGAITPSSVSIGGDVIIDEIGTLRPDSVVFGTKTIIDANGKIDASHIIFKDAQGNETKLEDRLANGSNQPAISSIDLAIDKENGQITGISTFNAQNEVTSTIKVSQKLKGFFDRCDSIFPGDNAARCTITFDNAKDHELQGEYNMFFLEGINAVNANFSEFQNCTKANGAYADINCPTNLVVNLTGANLTGAYFIGTGVRELNAEGAVLVKTKIEADSSMVRMDLRSADLTGASISIDNTYTNPEIILESANLRGATFSQVFFDSASYEVQVNGTTICVDGESYYVKSQQDINVYTLKRECLGFYED